MLLIKLLDAQHDYHDSFLSRLIICLKTLINRVYMNSIKIALYPSMGRHNARVPFFATQPIGLLGSIPHPASRTKAQYSENGNEGPGKTCRGNHTIVYIARAPNDETSIRGPKSSQAVLRFSRRESC